MKHYAKKKSEQLKIAAVSAFSGQLVSLLGVPFKRKKKRPRAQTTSIQRISLLGYLPNNTHENLDKNALPSNKALSHVYIIMASNPTRL